MQEWKRNDVFLWFDREIVKYENKVNLEFKRKWL